MDKIYPLLIVLWLLSQPSHAFQTDNDLQNNMSHMTTGFIETLQRTNEVVEAAPYCPQLSSLARSDIEQLYPREAWEDGLKMPTLLDDHFYAPKDVCEDARKKNKADGVSKPYAIILYKSHLCDGHMRSCLFSSWSFFDKCNKFLQNNFQTYHTRTFAPQKKPEEDKFKMQETPGTTEISNAYGEVGPKLHIIDLSDCSLVTEISNPETGEKRPYGLPPAALINPDGSYKMKEGKIVSELEGQDPITRRTTTWMQGDPLKRFQAMKDSITAGLKEYGRIKKKDYLGKIPEEQRNLSGKDLNCSNEEREKFPEIPFQRPNDWGQQAENSSGMSSIRLGIDLLRIPMNRQYYQHQGSTSTLIK